MMGRREGQKALFSYQVDLDKRVRADHPLRRVHARIDFGFVRQEVAGLYGYNGNVSEHPAVVMKMMFLLFYEDVRSERELMRIIPECLDYLWFLGYGLDEEVPNHSVLSKARRRWGVEVFERLMEGSFADAANHHGFKRARWRRLWRQRIQDYLIAVAQNVRLLLRKTCGSPAATAQAPVSPVPDPAAFVLRLVSRLAGHFRCGGPAYAT